MEEAAGLSVQDREGPHVPTAVTNGLSYYTATEGGTRNRMIVYEEFIAQFSTDSNSSEEGDQAESHRREAADMEVATAFAYSPSPEPSESVVTEPMETEQAESEGENQVLEFENIVSDPWEGQGCMWAGDSD